jgi:hypothetical protein
VRLSVTLRGPQGRNDEKQKRDCETATKLMLLSLSFSFCFVTSEPEKSNFYKDLDTLITIDFKKHEDKNKST